MLQSLVVPSPDDKIEVFKSMGYWAPETSWVVNDLETKLWLQDQLHQDMGETPNECPPHNPNGNPSKGFMGKVFRASEWWEKILSQKDSRWKPISETMAEFLIEKWMTEILRQSSFKISSKDARRVYKTMGQILPLLSHFQGEEALDQWFQEQEKARQRWEDWYQMGRRLWSCFLEKHLIPQEWIKGVLVNEEFPRLDAKPLVVDLGLDIDDVEGELFLHLSRSQDVLVIIPQTEMENPVYQDLRARSPGGQKESQTPQGSQSSFVRLPSMLAEVKHGVAQARQWLDEGVAPAQIALISSEIENYWPTLYEHLKLEGIPAKKAVTTALSQMPLCQKMMARIRVALGKVVIGDGEQILYDPLTPPLMTYHQFHSQLSQIYETHDYQRDKRMKKIFPSSLNPDQGLSFKDYLQAVMEIMGDETILETLALESLFEFNEKLKVSQWTEFLDRHLATTEKTLYQAPQEGIHILSLKACQNLKLSHVVVLGLSEPQLLDSVETSLQWTDIESIKLNFGFNLPHGDRHQLQRSLYWFQRKKMDQVIYTQGETDFSGHAQSPSLFWLKEALHSGHSLELDSPSPTRWDHLSQTNPQEFMNGSEKNHLRLMSFIQRDQGEIPTDPVVYKNLSLSPSSYEEFFQCPFKLFAKKALGLKDNRPLDLDMDPMNQGRLLHKICEDIISHGNFQLTHGELSERVEKARLDLEIVTYTGEIWDFLKPYYIKMAHSFMEMERDWRKTYPNTQTLGLEKEFKTHIQMEDESWGFHPEMGIPFKGILDRIDTNDQDQVAIMDYKTSDSSLTQYSSWLEKGKFQIAAFIPWLLWKESLGIDPMRWWELFIML